jgi:hypothetical protein
MTKRNKHKRRHPRVLSNTPAVFGGINRKIRRHLSARVNVPVKRQGDGTLDIAESGAFLRNTSFWDSRGPYRWFWWWNVNDDTSKLYMSRTSTPEPKTIVSEGQKIQSAYSLYINSGPSLGVVMAAHHGSTIQSEGMDSVVHKTIYITESPNADATTGKIKAKILWKATKEFQLEANERADLIMRPNVRLKRDGRYGLVEELRVDKGAIVPHEYHTLDAYTHVYKFHTGSVKYPNPYVENAGYVEMNPSVWKYQGKWKTGTADWKNTYIVTGNVVDGVQWWTARKLVAKSGEDATAIGGGEISFPTQPYDLVNITISSDHAATTRIEVLQAGRRLGYADVLHGLGREETIACGSDSNPYAKHHIAEIKSTPSNPITIRAIPMDSHVAYPINVNLEVI